MAVEMSRGLGASPQILCVDDDSYLIELLSFMLERDGYIVRTASCGAEALHQLGRERADAIILDVNLPDVSGYALCAKIRETYDTPVIMLSARALDEDVVKGFNHGGDDYIHKPFSVQVFLSRLRALLRRTRQAMPRQEGVYLGASPQSAVELGMHG